VAGSFGPLAISITVHPIFKLGPCKFCGDAVLLWPSRLVHHPLVRPQASDPKEEFIHHQLYPPESLEPLYCKGVCFFESGNSLRWWRLLMGYVLQANNGGDQGKEKEKPPHV
jgi:hypothetical protein